MSRNKPSKKAKRDRTDKEKLELFFSKVNELRETRLAVSGFSIHHNIHYERGQPIQSMLDQPEETYLKEYLMTFRHFISESEDTFLGSIFNICYKRSIDEETKGNIIQLRKIYENIKIDNSMRLYINEVRYTPLQITDIYLNGKYFHNDLEYQQLIDNLDPFIVANLRKYFLNFLIDTSKIIIITSNNIELAFKGNLFDFGD